METLAIERELEKVGETSDIHNEKKREMLRLRRVFYMNRIQLALQIFVYLGTGSVKFRPKFFGRD